MKTQPKQIETYRAIWRQLADEFGNLCGVRGSAGPELLDDIEAIEERAAEQFVQGIAEGVAPPMYLQEGHAQTYLDMKSGLAINRERAWKEAYSVWVCHCKMIAGQKHKTAFQPDHSECLGLERLCLPSGHGGDFNDYYTLAEALKRVCSITAGSLHEREWTDWTSIQFIANGLGMPTDEAKDKYGHWIQRRELSERVKQNTQWRFDVSCLDDVARRRFYENAKPGRPGDKKKQPPKKRRQGREKPPKSEI